MNRKNTAIGIILIFLGIFMYMKNFRIGAGSLLTLFLGLGLLYGYYLRREQPFAIFGGIFTAVGLISVLYDARFFRINMTFEAFLIVLGFFFMFVFYSRNARGFIFPGMILPAVGIYLILVRIFNDRYASPSIFILLGFAFYAIYFIAYMGDSGWSLIPATILMLYGVLSYAFIFKIITWSMIYMHRQYLLPLLMIGTGVLVLLGLFRKKS